MKWEGSDPQSRTLPLPNACLIRRNIHLLSPPSVRVRKIVPIQERSLKFKTRKVSSSRTVSEGVHLLPSRHLQNLCICNHTLCKHQDALESCFPTMGIKEAAPTQFAQPETLANAIQRKHGCSSSSLFPPPHYIMGPILQPIK